MTAQAKTAGGLVTVACRLPNGCVLDFRRYEPQGLDGRSVLVRDDKRRIVLNGWAHRVGETPPLTIKGSYALTPNVDAALWDEWVKTHEDSDLLVNGVIFAEARYEDAGARAAEQSADLKRVFAPANPKDADFKGMETATDDRGKALVKHNAELV